MTNGDTIRIDAEDLGAFTEHYLANIGPIQAPSIVLEDDSGNSLTIKNDGTGGVKIVNYDSNNSL